jgi:hypothetical protein
MDAVLFFLSYFVFFIC